jgi:hypothetical protein
MSILNPIPFKRIKDKAPPILAFPRKGGRKIRPVAKRKTACFA